MKDKSISLENLKNMDIDQIVELYKNGYTLEDPKLTTLQTACSTVDLIRAGAIGFGIGGLFMYVLMKHGKR